MEGNRDQSAGNKDISLFSSLIMMLGTSAMQQLGKIVNPMTGKTEVSLEGAQASIDMLDMLKEKTQGNLKAEEEKMLTDLLSTLQMNYVETAQDAKKQQGAAQPETPQADKNDAKESGPDKHDDSARPQPEQSGSHEEKREPKFHKSYGG